MDCRICLDRVAEGFLCPEKLTRIRSDDRIRILVGGDVRLRFFRLLDTAFSRRLFGGRRRIERRRIVAAISVAHRFFVDPAPHIGPDKLAHGIKACDGQHVPPELTRSRIVKGSVGGQGC